MKYQAILFDLDGVIADTATYHFEAWRMIGSKYNIQLEDSFEEKLKGIDRACSLKLILKHGNVTLDDEQFAHELVLKNEHYLKMISRLTPNNCLPGISTLFKELNENNIKIVIASASLNAKYILEKLQLIDYIDGIANPKEVNAPKPAPDIFLEAARIANTPIVACLGIEDAIAGVSAIKAAGMDAIAIGEIEMADYILESTNELTYEFIASL